jgi:hypothetical protein
MKNGSRARIFAGRARTSPVRIPAQVSSDPEDPLARVVGDAGTPVQRIGDRALRDAGPLRDVSDGDSSGALLVGHSTVLPLRFGVEGV